MTETTLRRTPLHDEHEAAGARMVPFAGYAMPIQYSGIRAEHQAVREAAGIFDVSHMGEFIVQGSEALDLVQHVVTNDASKLEEGQAQYALLPREDGTLLDDLIVYRRPGGFMLVVNAANRQKDFAWIERQARGFDVELSDRSDETGLIALQGPRAQEILARVTEADLDAIAYYRSADGEVQDRPVLISRTGYTGEDGFELYLGANDASLVWRALVEAGAEDGLLPAGLGARDSLRLEVGYALYGNDIDESRTAYEAGLGWTVKLGKGEFVGRDALAAQKEEGAEVKLTGFRLSERGFPRPGYPVRLDGREVGAVTSGVLSPTLGVGIGLTYLPVESTEPGTELEVVIRGKAVPARVERPPFYREGSIRR